MGGHRQRCTDGLVVLAFGDGVVLVVVVVAGDLGVAIVIGGLPTGNTYLMAIVVEYKTVLRETVDTTFDGNETGLESLSLRLTSRLCRDGLFDEMVFWDCEW